MDYFIFNGVKSTDKNVVLKSYRPIFLPQRNVDYESIPGRHGSLEFDDGTYQDIVIEAECAILGSDELEVMSNAYLAKLWLSQKGWLSFWDDPQRLYIGRIMNQIPLDQQTAWGDVRLLFRCEPFAYKINSPQAGFVPSLSIPIAEQITAENASGSFTITSPRTIEIANNGAFETEPYFRIEGSFTTLALGDLIINRPLSSGVLYVDNENIEVYTIEAGSRVNYLPQTSGKPIKLVPGNNTININGTNLNFTLYYLVIERW